MAEQQVVKILRYMLLEGSITPLDAFREFGCMRLAARIYDLRQIGVDINEEMISGKNRFGESVHYSKYTLADPSKLTGVV